METKTVYIVYSPDYMDTTDIYGVFDSKERVDEFLNRFKDRVDELQIREMVLNPQFQGDKKRNPYCAILYKSGMAMLSVISNPADCDKAIKNEHEIIEIDGEPERLFCYFLAETRDQAWAEGMARMEKLVELGEFKLDGEIYKEY
ncbi:hypothetical protein GCM10011386_38990 [Parapedobacter defluvii]|uniref:Uncharacterized protein n=1 Tax=Parapedobacter defluvii TaxID=2045106 RepID=A0ABQ1MLN5_9SPHI|nr:hypothetical protein [Parapedobacter defluvii]GGC42903.1 hypothetical protein GCM10011386_38990 [Parapedobacter defluvii]